MYRQVDRDLSSDSGDLSEQQSLYILMAGIDACMDMILEKGDGMFREYTEIWNICGNLCPDAAVSG